jgi:hypothetical protein
MSTRDGDHSMGSDSGRSPRLHAVGDAVVLAAVLTVLFLTGCGTSEPAVTAHLEVDAVHVLRTSAFPGNHLPPLDQTVADAARAQRLYDAIQALPPFPTGEFFCPADFGEAYSVMFFRKGVEVSWAIVKPDGCRGVSLPTGGPRWSATRDQFWQVFADALTVPESALFPIPRPDGPSAPTPLPGQP